ncbi:Protein Xrp2 [Cichlidogyrus casuarinus]|uniref:Protein Xrp2 n=1 Tax=Cichlidogyrus casuarinus TaxID=1844966 RepID=A0ABD2PZP0_9PLAT
MRLKKSPHRAEEQRKGHSYVWGDLLMLYRSENNSLDPADFICDGVKENIVLKRTGQINGQQFIIKNCSSCFFFLLDHFDSLNIDNVSDSAFIVGPVKRSIFLRNCMNCKVLVACQQLRMRDCSLCDVYTACVSVPIIENSSKIRFGPYQLWYTDLLKNFNDAGLSIFNNNWSEIHDFSKSDMYGDSPNYSLLGPQSHPQKIFPTPMECVQMFLKCDALKHLETSLPSVLIDIIKNPVILNYDSINSVVPLCHRTLTETQLSSICLSINSDQKLSKSFLLMWRDKTDSEGRRLWKNCISLVQFCEAFYATQHVLAYTRELEYNSEDLLRIFGKIFSSQPAINTPMVMLEYHSYSNLVGSDLRSALAILELDSQKNFFVSDQLDNTQVQQILDRINSFTDIQMNTG